MNNRIRRMVDNLLRNSRIDQMYGRVDRAVRPSSRQRADRASFEPLEVRQLLSTYAVTSAADDGSANTLRWAITSANANAGTDLITFSIGAGGAQTIKLKSALGALPMITDTVNINGASQTGYTNAPLITLDGSNVGASDGLLLGLTSTKTSAGSTVRGLDIVNFGLNAIEVITSNNKIVGNYLGTDGSAQLNNGASGVFINGTTATSSGVDLTKLSTTATGNIIGGVVAADRNIISANNLYGVYISGTNANTNTVEGNFIGTDATGSFKLANAGAGVQVESISNTIGGLTATPGTGAGNLISGNGGSGINVNGNKSYLTKIYGNLIGTDITGTSSIENFAAGVQLNSFLNQVGSESSTLSRNIISGNKVYGVYTTGLSATGNTIVNNYIGTDISGTSPLPNGTAGVELASDNTVKANVISGNAVYGIEVTIDGIGSTITSNLIGLNAAGNGAIANQVAGIISNTSKLVITSNTISGNTVGLIDKTGGNTIAGNLIGLNPAGTMAIPNVGAGLVLDGVGGDTIGIGVALNADGKSVGVSGTGNTISGNGTDGIQIINGASGVSLIGNYIGTNPAGTAAIPNGNDGINITGGTAISLGVVSLVGALWGSPTNDGTTPQSTSKPPQNVISGNTNNGLEISGTSSNVVVYGNRIGTNLTGTSAVPNQGSGVFINNVSGVVIGGDQENATTAGTLQGGVVGSTTLTAGLQLPDPALKQRNIISGNTVAGITITGAKPGTGTATKIINNYIGLDVSGTLPIANNVGIHLSNATGVTVGGTLTDFRNVISGNTTDGVLIDGTLGGNFVYSNYIGTDYSGLLGVNLVTGVSLGNGGSGVDIVGSPNNKIGVLNQQNVISANATGITISGSGATGNSVLANTIGLSEAIAAHAVVRGVNQSPYVDDSFANQTVIANGDTTPSSADGTNFTPTTPLNVNDNGVFRTFYVYNDGISTLSISAPTIIDSLGAVTATSHFTVTTPPPVSLAPGEVGSFVVYFDALAAGTFSNVLKFTTNDPSKGTIFFTLSGTVQASANVVVPTTPPVTAALAGVTFPTTGVNSESTVQLVGNTGDGVFITNNASNNIIGSFVETNTISRNGAYGIHLFGPFTTGNLIQYNYIGTSTTGDTRTTLLDVTLTRFDYGNISSGVFLESAGGNTIGGTVAFDRNVISGNGGDGITIDGGGASNNTIEGNYIGLDANGIPTFDSTKALLTVNVGNVGNGIQIRNGAINNIIGGSTTATLALNNVITNNQIGILIKDSQTTGNSIIGNYIGVDSTGGVEITFYYGNSGDGIYVGDVADNTIGGPTFAASVATGNGNVIIENGGNGISLLGGLAGGNSVLGNSIQANFGSGVYITSPNNIIGSTDGPNTISGNSDYGVYILGSLAKGNQIVNNFITGQSAGVYIDSSSNNIIGDGTNHGNFIAGNDNGIVIVGLVSTGNKIIGNFIGGSGFGNRVSGISIQSPNNIIGGLTTGERNIISNNGGDGILIQGISSTGNQILGNIIGLDFSGTIAEPNAGNGIFIVGIPGMTIGGTTATAMNVISANLGAGIYISGQSAIGDIIVGNYIGTDLNGNVVQDTPTKVGLGNRQFGVRLDSSKDRVGGVNAGEGNIIAGNIKAGVYVFGSTAIGDSILGNSIFLNGQLGIELGNGLLNINQVGGSANPNPSINPNNFQNFPIIDSTLAGSTNLTAHIDTVPNTYYRIEIFGSTDGQAQTLLGYATIQTDSAGHATFTVTLTTAPTAGQVVTATATVTDATNSTFGDTSELSNIAPVIVGSAHNLVDVPIDATISNGTVAGTLVSALVSANDFDTPIAYLGIAVIGVDATTSGTYWYTVNNGTTWAQLSLSSSATNATLLGPTARIQFVPTAPTAAYLGVPLTSTSIPAGITFKTWDQARGTSGATGVDTTTSSVTNNGVTDNFVFSVGTQKSTVNVVIPTPVITGFTVDTGVVGDGITTDHNLTIFGTGSPGFWVDLTVTDITDPANPVVRISSTVSVQISAAGTWSFDETGVTLPQGLYSVTAIAKSQNVSNPTFSSATSVALPIQIKDLITVYGGATSIKITAGDTTPSLADGTDFGTVVIGGTDPTQITHTFTVTNTGDTTAVITSIDVSNGNFTVVLPTGAALSIAPGGSTTFPVTISTAILGIRNATITIHYATPTGVGSTTTPYTFDVTGLIAPSAPIITGVQLDTGTDATDGVTIDPALHIVGTSIPNGVVTLTIYHTDSLGVTTSSVIGSATALANGTWDFNYTSVSLAPGDYQFTATVFDPVSSQTSVVSAIYRVKILQQIQLYGYDTATVPNQNPIATGSTTHLASDGTVYTGVAGTTPNIHKFTISNPGNTDLQITSITVPAGFLLVDASGNAISNPLNLTITSSYPSGPSFLDFYIELLTSTIGTPSGTVTITWNNVLNATPTPTYTFDIAGTVYPAPPVITGIDYDPFPPQAVTVDQNIHILGTAGPGLLITLYRTDLGATPIGTVFADAVTGAWDFNYTATTLNPNPSVPYVFTAIATDVATGLVSDPSAGLSVTILDHIKVQGNSTNIPLGATVPNVTDGTDFGTTVNLTTPVVHTFVITNPGNVDLDIDSVTLPAGFSLVNSVFAPITPGSSYNLDIRLDTSVIGVKSGNLTINYHNAAGTPTPYSFAIQGTVIPAPPVLTSITVDTSLPHVLSTVDQNILINGTSVPGIVISLFRADLGATSIGSATTDPVTGDWSFDYEGTTLAPGTYTFTAIATEPISGLSSTVSLPFVVTILKQMNVQGNSTDPITGLPTAYVDINSGSTTPLDIDGTEFGTTVYQGTPTTHTFVIQNPGNIDLSVDSILLPPGYSLATVLNGSVVIQPNGSYSFSVNLDTATLGFKTGHISILYHNAIDPGPVSYSFAIDGKVIPSPPVFTSITPGIIVNGVAQTTSGTFTLKGTDAPNVTITLSRSGAGVIGQTVSDASGNWSYTDSGLSVGSYNYTAIATDDQNGPASTGASSDVSAVFTVKVLPSSVVTNTNDAGTGSLRQAILDANAATSSYAVNFAIPNASGVVQTINLTSPLPKITNQIWIDGSTEQGFVFAPLIRIDGTNAGLTNGLTLGSSNTSTLISSSSGSIIRGLIVTNFSLNGIEIDTANNQIAGSYVGTDGINKLANHNDGIFVNGTGFDSFGNAISNPNARNNEIGGPNAADRNVVSSNNVFGIHVSAGASSGTSLDGNWVGITSDGKLALANAGSGVEIESSGNFIGSNASNVISGNGDSGITLNGVNSSSTTISGNLIGTDSTGSYAIPNAFSGVTLNSGGNSISNNTISGNKGYGVYISGTSAFGNSIYSNDIGLNITGSYAVANRLSGVFINTSGNSVFFNHISGNTQNGILISGVLNGVGFGSYNSIFENVIGLDATDSYIVGNGGVGLLINNSSGSNSIDSNTVSGNAVGIEIDNIHSVPDAFISPLNSPNELYGNFIGTDPTGNIALGNLGAGLILFDNVNTIVGTETIFNTQTKTYEVLGSANVISGNGGDGIVISGGSNKLSITDNYIGTNLGGTAAIGNKGSGINIQDGNNNLIGVVVELANVYGNPLFDLSDPTNTTGQGPNIISGNEGNGILISGATSTANNIMGNMIGTDWSGTYAVGNVGSGIYIDGAPGNIIGGTIENSPTLGSLSNVPTAAVTTTGSDLNPIDPNLRQRNIISGNGIGITIHGAAATGNIIVNNYIGVDVTGTLPITTYYDPSGTIAPWTPVANQPDSIQVTSLAYAPANYIGRIIILINGSGMGLVYRVNSVTAVVGGGYILNLNNTVDTTFNYYQVYLTSGNTIAGIELDGAVGNTIGGVGTAGAANPLRNVISAGGDGVLITGGSSANNILGNYIGVDYTGTFSTDSTGLYALGNIGSGVNITNGKSNVISSNIIGSNGTGVSISGTGSTGNSLDGTRIGESVNLSPVMVVRGVDEDRASNPNLLQTLNHQVSIVNGDTTPSIFDGTDFTANPTDPTHASIVEFGPGVERDFFIYNDGVAALTLGAITFPDQQKNADGSLISTHFTVVQAPAASIAPGQYAEFRVYFDSDSVGTFTHVIQITSNDPNAAKFFFTLTGTVVAPNPVPNPLPPTYPLPVYPPVSTPVDYVTGVRIPTTAQVQQVGNFGDGVYISAGASGNIIGTLTGVTNVISHNLGNGVHIKDVNSVGNIVQNNYIGLDHTGDVVPVNAAAPATEQLAVDFMYAHLLGNTLAGVLIESAPGNQIGTAAVGGRNYISDNGGEGVTITGGGADSNVVVNNFIGLDGLGTASYDKKNGILLSIVGLGNGSCSVHVTNGATNNIIGGAGDLNSNYIASSGGNGVWFDGLSTTGNQVQGNFIGINGVGDSDFLSNDGINAFYAMGGHYGNAGDGVLIDNVANNTVGGSSQGQGNHIDGNSQNGVHLKGANTGGNAVYGNIIGSGSGIGVGNGGSGIYVESANNRIGGTQSFQSNSIFFNGNSGVYLYGTAATGNMVYNNQIDRQTGAGVTVDNAPGNFIGSASNGGNIITVNDIGILITGLNATGNYVYGNLIGNRGVVDGEFRGNKLSGIQLLAPNNIIGGINPGEANVISGNGGDGVLVQGPAATGNTIQGNLIGTDKTGTQALGNFSNGIFIVGVANLTIGGTAPGAGNTISGNSGIGIYISGQFATQNSILGNFIGTDSSGNVVTSDANGNSLGNHLYGVRIDSQNNVVGGLAAGSSNVIAGNLKAGVAIISTVGLSNPINNTILNNSIFGNGRLGIDLGGDLLNVNSPDNTVTAGPNNLQNFPIIDSVSDQTVTMHLDTLAGQFYYIELFRSVDGQAAQKVGSARVQTDANGYVSFVPDLTVPIAPGDILTATATRAANNTTTTAFFDTSEISNSAPVLQGAYKLNDVAVNTGTSLLLNPGTLVSSLMTSNGVSLVSDIDTPVATMGIAVIGVGNDPAKGTYRYSIDKGVTWTTFSPATVSPTTAILLGPTALVQFVPTANFLGPVAIGLTFKAWDQGNGNSGDVNVDTTHSSVTNSLPTPSRTDYFVFSQASFTSTVNVVLPAPVVTGFSPDSGVVGDMVTSSHNLKFFGTGSANYFVHVFINGVDASGQISVDAQGKWSFDYSGVTLPKGIYTITAYSTDGVAGDAPSALSAPFVITVLDPVTASGGTPAVNITTGSTTTSTADGTDFGSVPFSTTGGTVTHIFSITNTGDITATITGVTSNSPLFSVGAVIFPGNGNHVLNPGTAPDFQGDVATFAVTFNPTLLGLQTGTIDIQFSSNGTTIDYTFNVSGTIVPAPPVLTGIIPDTGTTGDNITVAQNISLVGTSAPGTLVNFFRSDIGGGTTSIGNVVADPSGNFIFNYTATPLAPATYFFTSTATNLATGDVSPMSGPFRVVIQSVIAVTGLTNSIPSGQTTTSVADGTDFGTTAFGGTGQISTFVISNASQVDMKIDQVTLPQGYSLASSGTNVIVPANSVYSLLIQLDGTGVDSLSNPVTTGTFSGTVNIAYSYVVNTTIHSNYTFNITGQVIPAAPTITGVTTDTSGTGSGVTVDRTLKINGNQAAPGTTVTVYITDSLGNTTLVGTTQNIDGSGAWSVDYTAITLAPGVYVFTATDTDTSFTPPITSAISAAYSVTILPEMTVTGNGTTISSGDTTPSTTDGTDFGKVGYAGNVVVHTFVIKNTGNVDLTLASLTLPTGYSLLTTLPTTPIAAGASFSVQIQLDTTGASVTMGIKRGSLVVNFSYIVGPDTLNAAYTYSITGQILPTPPIMLGITPDTGTADDNITVAQAIHIFGTSAPNSVITLYVNGSLTPAGTVVATGTTWDFNYTAITGQLLAPGVYHFTTTATDPSTTPPTVSAPSTDMVVTILSELAVTGNGTNIAPPNTPTSADGTDYGSVLYGATTNVTHTFTVLNTGNVSLNITNVQVPTGFKPITITTPIVVSSTGTVTSTDLSLTLDSSVLGIHAGNMVITYTYNDGNGTQTKTFTIAVIGVVHPSAPVITGITPDSNPAGLPHVGTTATVARTIKLTGTAAPGTTINIFRSDITGAIGTTIVDSTGKWTYVGPTGVSNLAIGNYTYSATSTYTPAVGLPDISTPSLSYSVQILPIIGVRGNGVTMTDGQSAAIPDDGTDFGTATYGDGGIIHAFSIQNPGNVTLVLNSVTLPTGFEIVDAAGRSTTLSNVSIAAGSSSTVYIKLDSAALAHPAGNVVFHYNQNSGQTYLPASTFTFAIKGVVKPSAPVFTTITPNVGQTNANGAITILHNVSFTGTAPPNVTISLSRSDLSGSIGTTRSDASGNWSFNYTGTTLDINTYTFYATASTIPVPPSTSVDTSITSLGYIVQVVPTINVQGNLLNITNGSTTPSTLNSTDFGSPILGAPGVVHNFVIQNPSNINLIINSIDLPVGFSLVNPVSNAVIAAGTSLTVSVRLDTDSFGSKSGNLVVKFDQSASPLLPPGVPAGTYSFAVAGVVGTNDSGNVVTALFQDLLGRPADPGAIDGFTPMLDNARLTTLLGVAKTLTNSAEAEGSFLNDPKTGLFMTLLHRIGAPSEVAYYVNAIANGMTQQQVLAAFVSSPEYYVVHGSDDTLFLKAAYNDILGRPIDAQGQAAFLAVLTQARNVLFIQGTGVNGANLTAARLQIANTIIGSTEYAARVVTQAYAQILNRGTDAGGLNAWVAQLQAGLRIEDFRATLMASAERFQISGSTGEGWLKGVYQLVLSRPIDSLGLVNFTNVILNGFTAARTSLVATIINTDEYRSHVVQGYYQKFLGRDASSADLANWSNQIKNGMAFNSVAITILGSDEYFNHVGGTNKAFVDHLFSDVLNRQPDSGSEAAFILMLTSGSSRASVASLIVNSNENYTNLVTAAFTTMLNRTASPSEVSYWVTQFKNGTRIEQILIFLGSTNEFFLHINPL